MGAVVLSVATSCPVAPRPQGSCLRSDDLRALGRIGQPVHVSRQRTRRLAVRRAGTATVATRRPALPRPLLAGMLVAVLCLAYLGIVAAGQAQPADPQAAPAPTEDTEQAEPRRATAAADRSQRAPVDDDVFGIVDDLQLHLPHGAPLSVAFHEATRPEALPIEPLGRLEANDNPTRFAAPADSDGPDYRVLSSRGRGRPATSAVDIVLPDGARAFAPVSGTVVEVRQYALSGKLQDWRVVIAPDGRRDLHVVLIHLHEPEVAEGDRVTAGATPIGVARLLPFTSHVDYVVGERHPHVHLEVKPATSAAPIDPNAPAVEPGAELDVVNAP